MKARRIFIGLGSNLGDRAANLQAGLDALRQTDGTANWTISAVYQTAAAAMAADETASPDFLNAVAAADSDRPAVELLAGLRVIEQRLGRTGKGEHRSRTLDLDLLACGDEVIDNELQLPHPRLHERWFVLAPFADVAPDWRHPLLGCTVAAMLRELEQQPQPDEQALPGTRHAAGLV